MGDDELRAVWYAGHQDGSVTVITGLAEEPLPHLVKHSHAGWDVNSFSVQFNVAIRAQELEVLRMPSDLDGVGLEAASASAPEGVVPLLLVSAVPVVKVERGSASVVAATLALPAKLRDELGTFGALSLPQALLAAWPTGSYVPLGPAVREGLAAIGTEPRRLEIDTATVVGSIGTEPTTAPFTTPLLATGAAEVRRPVSTVGDAVAATFTIQRWVGSHASMVQVRSESPFSWGYAGSGPAELARCLLIHALGPRSRCVVCEGTGQVVYGPDGKEYSVAEAQDQLPGTDWAEAVSGCMACEDGCAVMPAMYQQFKFEVVAKFTPEQPWSMPQTEILDWYRRYTLRAVPSV